MAFTVETGDGVVGANAYIDVATADTFHTDRGNTAWTGDDSVKQVAIIKATDYVDKRFGTRFKGYRQTKGQGLEWPRLSAFDLDDYLLSGIPAQLQKAVSEYALIAIQIELLPIPARPFAVLDPATGTVSGGVAGQVTRRKERVEGAVEEENEYSDTAREESIRGAMAATSSLVAPYNLPQYPSADVWLTELITSPGVITLGRA